VVALRFGLELLQTLVKAPGYIGRRHYVSSLHLKLAKFEDPEEDQGFFVLLEIGW
jgi:hypothetical protein